MDFFGHCYQTALPPIACQHDFAASVRDGGLTVEGDDGRDASAVAVTVAEDVEESDFVFASVELRTIGDAVAHGKITTQPSRCTGERDAANVKIIG